MNKFNLILEPFGVKANRFYQYGKQLLYYL